MKELGQVFTPNFIVDKMIKMSDLESDIFNLKILEPSFGEGAFLLPIIERIIKIGKNKNKSDEEILNVISSNIYGVEIDNELFNKTTDEIKNLLIKYNLRSDVSLNLFNVDFLDFDKSGFDVIIGNPPYIRIHDIDNNTRLKIKNYEFSTGNTDLYIIFFEKCINLLKETGKLIFITPNSYIRNSSQKSFRKFLTKNKLIDTIIDFGANKIFENADTYTAITSLNKNLENNEFTYQRSDLNSICSESKILFSADEWFTKNNTGNFLGNICNVQYGFATNADKIFISDNFDNLEPGILRDIVKGSRIDSYKLQKVIFPYKKINDRYVALTEDELKENYPKAYEYLYLHKEELESRNLEKNTSWFEFARSQSIQTVDAKKLVIKQIINNEDEIITYDLLPAGVCVYSGLYITASSFDKIKEVIETKEFCAYLKENGKDLSGGYKSFNTKLIKNYQY